MSDRPRSRSSGEAIRRSASTFLAKNARLLERLRCAYLFERGSSRPILAVLDGYRNEDGGFGHALEPDLRGPESEPIPVWTALGLLDEVGEVHGPVLRGILRWLDRAWAPGGGIPFVFREAAGAPHAPWWETGPGRPRGSLNPTAGLAAYLHRNRIRTPWLDRATRWCWSRIDRWTDVNPYELRVVLAFLDHVPDRARAEETLERLRPGVRAPQVVDLRLNAEGESFRPLDYSPTPGLRSRRLFTVEEIERNLVLVERSQRADGGWAVHFPIWTPITQFEWEGCQTLEMLKLLGAHGRLALPPARVRRHRS